MYLFYHIYFCGQKRMKLIKHKKNLIIGTIVTRNQNFGTSSNNLYKIKEDVVAYKQFGTSLWYYPGVAM